MGNLLIALPHLKAMLARHPDALLVTDQRYHQIVQTSLPGEQRLLFYPGPALSAEHPWWKRLHHYLRFVTAMRRFRADQCLDLEGEQKSATLALLSGAAQRHGPQRRHSHWFYTDSQRRENPGHRWHGYALFSDPAAPEPARYLPLQADREADAQLKGILKKQRLDPQQPRLLIHVGATKYHKMWHPQQFALLCQRARRLGLTPVLIGAGSKDREQIARVQECLTHPVINLCDQLDLAQLIALLCDSLAFVGNDSGPMHLAAACGLPTLGLFGPTEERLWQPLAENARILRWQPCARACSGKHCVHQHYPCLQRISVDQVLAALDEMCALPKPPRAAGTSTQERTLV
ncbi:MAG: glycosyltransferase family 9 protein [Alcanivorax sp.]|nr:glycosyltransferase family 9 protein [Alcanivorax sp.]